MVVCGVFQLRPSQTPSKVTIHGRSAVRTLAFFGDAVVFASIHGPTGFHPNIGDLYLTSCSVSVAFSESGQLFISIFISLTTRSRVDRPLIQKTMYLARVHSLSVQQSNAFVEHLRRSEATEILTWCFALKSSKASAFS